MVEVEVTGRRDQGVEVVLMFSVFLSLAHSFPNLLSPQQSRLENKYNNKTCKFGTRPRYLQSHFANPSDCVSTIRSEI